MNFKGLRLKRIIDLNPFTQIKDLFQSTVQILTEKDNVKIEYITVHTVKDFEQGRPDKIAKRYYDDENYIDALLKYNGVSNPFSIEEGRLMRIPTKEVLDASYKAITFKKKKGAEDLLTRFVDKDKKSNVDSSKEGFNSSKKRNIAPNVQINGQTGIARNKDKDKLILGANLTGNN